MMTLLFIFGMVMATGLITCLITLLVFARAIRKKPWGHYGD